MTVKIPAVWTDLLMCKLCDSTKIGHRTPKSGLDDPQRYFNDKRSIPVVLDNFYSAEIVLTSENEESYDIKALLKIGSKVIYEGMVWNKLESVVVNDGNDAYFTINLVWMSICK